MKLIFPNYARRIDENDLLTPTIQQNFAWTNREDYLEWVASWKAELHTRIAEIRRLKAIRRDKGQKTEDRNAANVSRQVLRVECFNLLLLRTEGKRLSAMQRNRRLETQD